MALPIIVGNAPLTVQFTDTTTYPNVTAWAWDFGDGETSTFQNPVHIYSYPGSFDVELQVYDADIAAWRIETKYNYVKVLQGVLKVAYTDKCFRRAVAPEQGFGWSEYVGDLPFPESGVGIVKAIDDLKQRCVIIFDAITRRPYLWANRSAPTGSLMERLYRDKETEYGGTEIPCRARTKEVRSVENRILRTIGTTAKIQPMNKNRIGRSGYNAAGLRNAQEVTMRIYRNGRVAGEASARDIPQDAEVSFDKKMEYEGFQVEIETTASEFVCTEVALRYLELLQKKYPSKVIMTEQNYANSFSLPVLWLARGDNLTVNFADNAAMTGAVAGTTTGPDGRTQSAIQTALTSNPSWAINNLTGDCCVGFWISGIVATTTVIAATNLTVNIRQDGSDYYLQWIDGNGTAEHLMNWDGSGWACCVITRSGGVLRFYENGVLIGSTEIGNNFTIGGTAQLMNAAVGSVFDVRMLGQVPTANAISYYYDDVVNNSGDKFCPPW